MRHAPHRTPRCPLRPAARLLAGVTTLASALVATPRTGTAQSTPDPLGMVDVVGPAVPPCGAATAARRPPGGGPRAASRGYLGLRLSELSEVRWTEEGRLVRYCAYPLVISVEPASPAERAGLGAGDTLVAYGSRDLVRDGPIPLDRLLVPGGTVRVRVRREGRTLTRPVVVGERPTVGVWAFGPGAPHGALGVARAPAAPGRSARSRVEYGWQMQWDDDPAAGDSARATRARGGSSSVRFRMIEPARPHRAPRPGARGEVADDRLLLENLGRDGFAPDLLAREVIERARAGDAPLVTYLRALPPLLSGAMTADGPAALAGAQLVTLDADLRDAVAGAPARGVFVLQVLPGTPAAEAGLRAGDVIVAAAGRPVETPAALQRALASRVGATRASAAAPAAGPATSAGGSASAHPARSRAEERAVSLRVARGGAAREVVLRW